MAVKSLCVDVCAFDGKSGLCIGGFRTRDEIRGWKKMTDHQRHQILSEKSRRQTKVERSSATLPVYS
jgi:uncharacterized protein